MPTFAYKAIGIDGRATSGRVEAASTDAAIEQVDAMGLMPTDIGEKGGAKSGESKTGKLRAAHVQGFFRQLSGLLAAGVPLARALQILGRESSSQAASSLWRQVHDEVSDGKSLAEAMAQHPQVFADVHVAMIRAGETGGFLDVVLKQIADFMTRERELKSRVVGAMIYPAVLAFVATGVVLFLLWWFIPRFSEIFYEFGESLPLLTRMVQGASFAVRDYGLIVLVGVVVTVVAARQAFASEAGQRFRDRAVLRLPGLGVVVSRFALVRFCRMFGTLIGAGVPMLDALRVAKESIGNQVLTDALETSIEQVRRGGSLSKGLATCSELFPPSVLEVLAVAEESGRLADELVRLSEEHEQELDRRLRLLVSLMEPAMLFVMAAMVGSIVIGMLLPVFDLWEAIE